MTPALIILLVVAIPIGLYAYRQHRAEKIEQPEHERDLLGEFRRWNEDGRP